jgi:hypothetical protein
MRLFVCWFALATLTSGTFLVSFAARALDLNPPLALETAETLPKNVRNPRFIDLFASLTSKFGDDGIVEGLGAPLVKQVAVRDMAHEQEDPAKSTLLRGLLKANGLEDGSVVGSTTGEVNTFADVKVAALAWGITDRFTMAAVLPIIHVNVTTSTGFVPSTDNSNLQTAEAALSRSSSPRIAQEANDKLNNAINSKLIRLGYDPIPANETISGIGDAQLIGKLRVYDRGRSSFALKFTMIAPTGTAPDPDKALDIPTGDGRVGAGLAAIYDFKLGRGWRWDSYASFIAMLPHHIVKRIPTSVDDPLSADKEEMFERTRSQTAIGTGVDHYFEKTGVIIGGGYSYQFLTRADYQPGTTYGADRYYLLGDQQPLEALHSVLLSVGFSTINWYNEKKFFYPFQVNFSYSHPFAGRNVASGDLMAGELVVFF